MNATMLDFRTRMSEIQKAVSRRERVTVSAHGRLWAVIVAWQDAEAETPSARDCAAAGMWADCDDMGDPAEWVRVRRAKLKLVTKKTFALKTVIWYLTDLFGAFFSCSRIVKGKGEEKMGKLKTVMLTGTLAALCGCSTSPVAFKSSSVPVPAQGYTVTGSDVTGTSDQIWVFGMGGSLSAQQHKAYKTALGSATGADALVGMSIESHGCFFPPFFIMNTVRVTGTPVKFNPPPAK